MKEVLDLLQKAVDREVERRNHAVELNLLELMSSEEAKRIDDIHHYTITKINKIHSKVIETCNQEDVIKLLKEAINNEIELKEQNKELNILGMMSKEDVRK